MASSLATRCTACGTVFRVVPDQLRVSEGWVRCGRCSEVFNAAEHLLDAHSGAPRRLGDEQPQQVAAFPAAFPAPSPAAFRAPPPSQFAPLPPRAPERLYDPRDDGLHDAPAAAVPGRLGAGDLDQDDDDLAHAPAFAPTAVPPAEPTIDDWHADSDFGNTLQETASPEPPAQQAVATADATGRFEPHIGDSIVSISPAASADPHGLHDLRATPRDVLPPAADGGGSTPSFLRRAERAQRWKQPRVRTALWALTVLAALGLLGQVLFVYRDLAAARFTLLRPALEQACGWLGCTVGEAHAIDSLVVESSGLVRVEKSSIYKLSVALRNRAAIAVAVPAIDIALTDAQGRLLARRVLRAAELGSNQPALAAGRDLALQATLQADTEPVAGYTIELFYP